MGKTTSHTTSTQWDDRTVTKQSDSAVRILRDIEERLADPTARGLANAVSFALRDGVLSANDKLPPIRTVAVQLGLSPTTVSAAWSLLARSGTVQGDGRRGTIITARQPGPKRYRDALEQRVRFRLDLSTGTPDPDLLPDLRPALRRVERISVPATYLDDPVLPALADVLHSDWPFPAERLTIVDGAMDGLALIAAGHLRFGDRVAVEAPGFPPLLDLLDSFGAVPLPVQMDANGPLPQAVADATASGIRALFFQPRAQNPTGVSLSTARLNELAGVLRNQAVLVVEDDSAGAIAATPALSIGAMLPDQTLHVRSYSKSHGPDLRLAALGGPTSLVDPLIDRRFIGQGWTSRLLQSLLVDLLTHASSIKTVDRARDIYAERRAVVVDALAAEGISVVGNDGLNIWLPVHDESAALLRLGAEGIGAAAGEPFWPQPRGLPRLRVTTALVKANHRKVAAALAACTQTRTHKRPV